MSLRALLKASPLGWNGVRVIEANQPAVVGAMQSERIGEAMWPHLGFFPLRDPTTASRCIDPRHARDALIDKGQGEARRMHYHSIRENGGLGSLL